MLSTIVNVKHKTFLALKLVPGCNSSIPGSGIRPCIKNKQDGHGGTHL